MGTLQQRTLGVAACGHDLAPTSALPLDGTRVRAAAAAAPFGVVVDAVAAPPPRGAPV